MIIPSHRARLAWAITAAAAIGGALVSLHYHRLGLTLSHYDARGHLVVARRIIDSITPGWQQIGAVWLPLPHLLNLVPVQADALYRTGASAVAISVAAFAAATGAIAWIVFGLTESAPAAVVAAGVFALNPNVLYLQATPMTEPLLLALIVVAVALLMAWCESADAGGPRRPMSRSVGWVCALACLTRYEAWPVTACALAIAAWALWRRGAPILVACRQVRDIAIYPALAIAGFIVFSRVVIGEWFTASGFFVPENKALGKPFEALAELGWGLHALSGSVTITIAAVGLGGLLVTSMVIRRRASHVLVLSLLASAALPWAAFVDGHPFRIRYMVPLIAIEAIGVGAAVGMFKRAAPVTALVTTLVLAYVVHPLDASAPMVLEAQWDRPNVGARQQITNCLRASYDGEKIMGSMGSLGHYMQETARDGFKLRDFLHEGNGDVWLAALETPRPYVGWLLIEEKAEGGDMLAKIARARPAFLEGFDRVCEGAGVALYRRSAPRQRPE